MYASIPYTTSWGTTGGGCVGISQSPNNNIDADASIDGASHEHFEAVTDPVTTEAGTAWVDTKGDEIADKCVDVDYGVVGSDGHNVVLNGHPYIMQLEWSNKAGRCSKN